MQARLVLCTSLVATLALTFVAGCSFESGAVSNKDLCRRDSDCVSGHVCSCGRCRAPEYATEDCRAPFDVDVPDTGTPDVADEVEPDTSAPDVRDDAPCPDDRLLNACGGCGDLAAAPGSACGLCGEGMIRCVDSDTVECHGDSENECGGCEALEQALGSPCGICNTGALICDGTDALVCEGGGENVCGGCDVLAGEPGGPCGTCGRGTLSCLDGTFICEGGDESNVCGGCANLPGEPGDACGLCQLGELACSADGETLECSEPDGRNTCGGCATLEAEPGTECGTCGTGTWACDGIDALTCEAGTNPCGGCGQLGDTIGATCGCGTETLACGGPDTLVCVDGDAFDAPLAMGTFDDHLGWRTVTGVLHDGADEDWYLYGVVDGPSALRPEATLEADGDYRLCVYYTRSAPGGPDLTCGAGTPATAGALTGCCSDNAGVAQEWVRIDGVDDASGQDDGEVTISVSTTLSAGSCVPYTLRVKL